MESRAAGRVRRARPRSVVTSADRLNGNLTPASSTSSLSELDNVCTDSENNDLASRLRPASRNSERGSQLSLASSRGGDRGSLASLPGAVADSGAPAAADDESDQETLELSKLRCSGERTEVVAERHKRRVNRCADYPGLAFGSSVFSSNTLMKLSVIKNELHNISTVQLKRAEGEVSSLGRRIQLLEEDLERSEERLNTATTKLAEASHTADESERMRRELESRSESDEERMDALETQLKEARFLAEQADRQYEEVTRQQRTPAPESDANFV